MKPHHTLLAATLLLSTTLTQAQTKTLSIGDPAPAFTGKIIQGSPLSPSGNFDPSKTYLLEFWATWCGPCKLAIPHLNELHKKYANKGLTLIAQDVREKDDAVVHTFLKAKSPPIDYTVALDDKSQSPLGSMFASYVQASGFIGIPQTYIIQNNTILWTGHPMELKEELIESILARTYQPDPELKAKLEARNASFAANDKIRDRVYAAMAVASDPSKEAELLAALEDLAKASGPGSAATFRLQTLVYHNRLPEALAFAEKAVADKTLDPATAAATLVSTNSNDPDILKAAKSYLTFAEAGFANLTNDTTRARISMIEGNQSEAITSQQKAIAALPQGFPPTSTYHKDLATYQANQLPPKLELPKPKGATNPADTFH